MIPHPRYGLSLSRVSGSALLDGFLVIELNDLPAVSVDVDTFEEIHRTFPANELLKPIHALILVAAVLDFHSAFAHVESGGRSQCLRQGDECAALGMVGDVRKIDLMDHGPVRTALNYCLISFDAFIGQAEFEEQSVGGHFPLVVFRIWFDAPEGIEIDNLSAAQFERVVERLSEPLFEVFDDPRLGRLGNIGQ